LVGAIFRWRYGDPSIGFVEDESPHTGFAIPVVAVQTTVCFTLLPVIRV